MKLSEWRKLLRNLRQKFSTRHTVFVFRRPMKENFGITIHYKGDKCNVYIDVKQIPEVQRYMLLHEWAHVMIEESGGEKIPHGPQWSKMYAKIYTAWERGFA